MPLSGESPVGMKCWLHCVAGASMTWAVVRSPMQACQSSNSNELLMMMMMMALLPARSFMITREAAQACDEHAVSATTQSRSPG